MSRRRLNHAFRLRRAAAGMEYASLLGVIAVVGLIALIYTGGSVANLFESISNRLGGGGDTFNSSSPAAPSGNPILSADTSSRVIDQSSLPQSCTAVSFTNTGDASVSGFSVPTITGAYVLTGCTIGCTGTLAPGSSCTVGVRPNSQVIGQAMTGTLTLVASSGGSAAVSLTGVNHGGLLTTDAAGIINQASIPGNCANVTFYNPGSTSVSGMGVPTVTGNYTKTGCSNTCGSTLAPGASCVVAVKGTGTSVNQSLSGSISIAATTGGTATQTLSGTVTAASSGISGPSSGGIMQYSNPGNCVPLVYTNTTGTGSGSLSVTFDGEFARCTTSQFYCGTNVCNNVGANQCGSSIAAGASCTIWVRGNRATSGGLSGSMTVSGTVAGAVTTSLSGTADLPVDTIVAGSLTSAPYLFLHQLNGFLLLSSPPALPTGGTRDVAFSPGGSVLALATIGAPYLTVYNVTGDPSGWSKVTLANQPTAACVSLAFSPNSAMLAAGCGSSVLIYSTSGWSLTTGPSTVYNAPYPMTFSPNGSMLAVGGFSPKLTVYNVPAWTTISGIAQPSAFNPALAFSPNGSYLAVENSSASSRVWVFNVGSWSRLPDFAAQPAGTVEGMSFSPNNAVLAVGNQSAPNGTYYNTTDWSQGTLPVGPSGIASDVKFTADGKVAIYGASSSATPYSLYHVGDWTRLPNPPAGGGPSVTKISTYP